MPRNVTGSSYDLAMTTSTTTRSQQPAAPARAARWAGGTGLAAWAALIAVAYAWGRGMPEAHLRTPPLFATFDPRVNIRLVPALLLAAATVAWGPRIAAMTPWRRLLGWTLAAGVAWAVALALLDGAPALTAPLRSPHDYLTNLHLVGSPGAFLAGFVQEFGRYSTHVQGHPPGMLLLAWGFQRVGLGGPGPLAALVVVAGASAAPAALVAAREACGEPFARRAAPFLALAPTAVWIATSGDALLAGVGAWAVALVVLATRNAAVPPDADARGRRRAGALALGGGVLFGATMFLSYGLVLLGLLPLVVAVSRRRLRPMLLASAGAATVVGAFALAGFWWPSGLAATRLAYRSGAGGIRPYGYFLVADLAALGVALGPACAAGLARLRGRLPWLLTGAGALAVLAADVSGLSKGEVERIWLPFTPWLLLATSALATQPGGQSQPGARLQPARSWLLLHLAAGLLVQALFMSPW